MKPGTKVFIGIAIIVAVLAIGEMVVTHFYMNKFASGSHNRYR